MFFVQKYVQGKIPFLIVIVFLCITNSITGYFLLTKKAECVCEECPQIPNTEEVVEQTKLKVDIKGYVKKPGVYEVEEGTIVNDLIKKAGGLKSNATTDNINLSKTLQNEDVVVISSKSELKKQTSTTTSTTTSVVSPSILVESTKTEETKVETSKEPNQKINLNTASKEELMTLSGIGEAKALSIIEYRTKTPFKDITEIMNISGIGESIYEKIKDFITV